MTLFYIDLFLLSVTLIQWLWRQKKTDTFTVVFLRFAGKFYKLYCRDD